MDEKPRIFISAVTMPRQLVAHTLLLLGLLICPALASADEIKADTGQLRIILTDFAERSSLGTADGDPHNKAALDQITYGALEKERALPAGVLARQLPAFAEKLAKDGAATTYERAAAAYVIRDYLEAERLFILAAHEAKNEHTPDLNKTIKALELAGSSARSHRADAQALTHLNAATALAAKDRQPIQWARVHQRLAEIYGARGDHQQAEDLLRQIIAIWNERSGPEHFNSRINRIKLAGVLSAQGKTNEAEAEYRSLLELEVRLSGPEHPSTLLVRSFHARALGLQGNITEAIAEYRAIIEISERVRSPEHPATLTHRSDLAAALAFQGLRIEAAGEHRKVLAIRERVLGPEHPDTLASLYDLAGLLYLLNFRQDALPLAQRAAETARKTLGPEHSITKLYEQMHQRIQPKK